MDVLKSLASKLRELATKYPDQDFGVNVAAVGEEVRVTAGTPASSEPPAALATSSGDPPVSAAEDPRPEDVRGSLTCNRAVQVRFQIAAEFHFGQRL